MIRRFVGRGRRSLRAPTNPLSVGWGLRRITGPKEVINPPYRAPGLLPVVSVTSPHPVRRPLAVLVKSNRSLWTIESGRKACPWRLRVDLARVVLSTRLGLTTAGSDAGTMLGRARSA